MPFARARNGRISYQIVAPSETAEDPQTILMIMGLGGSGAMWLRLLAQLPAAIERSCSTTAARATRDRPARLT